MSKNTSIILGDHFENFIKQEISNGRHSSTSEVIRSALRMLEIEKTKVEAINRALVVGENSGQPTSFNNKQFKAKMKKKLKSNV